MRIEHDIHVHTYLSSCCHEKDAQRPVHILPLAEEMGVKTIGFADHIWVNPALATSEWYQAQSEEQIVRLREDLSAIESPVRVLVGCEAETIAPGQFGLTRDFADTLDYVLLSCSHLHMKGLVAEPASDAPADVGRHLLAMFRSGVASGLPTAIAHPFLPFGYTDRFAEVIASISDEEFLDAFGLAAENLVGLEITTSFLPAPESWTLETPARFLRLAKQAGCRFSFGTDTHSPDAQRRLPELAPLVEAAGIEETDLIPLLREQN